MKRTSGLVFCISLNDNQISLSNALVIEHEMSIMAYSAIYGHYSQQNSYEDFPFSKSHTTCPYILHAISKLLVHEIITLVLWGSIGLIMLLKSQSFQCYNIGKGLQWLSTVLQKAYVCITQPFIVSWWSIWEENQNGKLTHKR